MKKMGMSERQNNLNILQSHVFDLLIIGGGITGAGVARDAALRGMKVALVEANDFASGTSSKSSKLIHGGIRYLENLEFHLVFEALNERTKLFEMAPHLIHPLRFMLPLYADSRVGMFKMGLGMWLYDALSLFQTPEMHERLSAKETSDRMPAIRSNELKGSYVYSDAYMDDDRLTIETIRSANEAGAICANYVKATGADFNQSGQISSVTCVDRLTGSQFKVEALHVVSSTGPWTDEVGKLLTHSWKKILRPTKGVHLTFSKERFPLSSAVVMAAEKSNRIVFGIPRHEMVIVGTTDTDFKESPDKVSCLPEDVEYLLKITDYYFPGAHLSSKDIISSYAGVRPLVDDGSSVEGKTSREHTIFTHSSGITFVAGGKYTTYRLIAEQVVDESLQFFSLEYRARLLRANTEEPLNKHVSREAFHQALSKIEFYSEKYNLPVKEVQILAERYGHEIEKILDTTELKNAWEIEAEHAIDHTMCLNLIDFFTRRTPLYLAQKDHGVGRLNSIANIFAKKLGWDAVRVNDEKSKLMKFIETDLKWKEAYD